MSKIDSFVEEVVKKEVGEMKSDIKRDIFETLKKEVMVDLQMIRPIEVNFGEKKKVFPATLKHEKTELVLTYIAARVPLLLVGPAGSGKTSIAVKCSETLDLDHYSISVNEQTSKADFLGYSDATGDIVKTNFRKAYENGGVFIIDEIDAGNPNILTVINSALSNDFCPFPDGMVKRHENFVCVCTANTFGEGENMQYIGRNILDAATRDRFTTIHIDYSRIIESAVMPTCLHFITGLRNHYIANNTLGVLSTRGGQRLEKMIVIKSKHGKARVSYDDVVDCLNLHLEVKKDAGVKNLVTNFVGSYSI